MINPNIMEISKEIVAEERNVRHGSNGFYDIRLLSQSDDELLIEVALSFFFQFIPNGADENIIWSQVEQNLFRQEWLRQIPEAWNRQKYLTHNGYNISLGFTCAFAEEVSSTQWQAHVMKLKSKNAFRTSVVCLDCYKDTYDIKFDSNDYLQKPGGRRQTAMIHEFGHMLGLPDEYKSSSTYFKGKDSIMNLGAEVRDRHLDHFMSWAKPYINDLINSKGEKPTLMETKNVTLLKALKSIIEAKTKGAEIDAVRAWRDGVGPDEGIHFVIRRRGSDIEIPYEEISSESFEAIEIEFSSAEDKEAELLIWAPKSWEGLEILFVE